MIRPPSPSIAGGTYFAYSSIPHHPDPLMRSVTFVRREAETGHLQKGHRMVGTAGIGMGTGARQPPWGGELASELDLFQRHQPPPDWRAVADLRAIGPHLRTDADGQGHASDRGLADIRVRHHAARHIQHPPEARHQHGKCRQARPFERRPAGGQPHPGRAKPSRPRCLR